MGVVGVRHDGLMPDEVWASRELPKVLHSVETEGPEGPKGRRYVELTMSVSNRIHAITHVELGVQAVAACGATVGGPDMGWVDPLPEGTVRCDKWRFAYERGPAPVTGSTKE